MEIRIVKASDGDFPLIHPDHVLWDLFGEGVEQIFDEERRLFYVAVTRAKEQLYCLVEGDSVSPFAKGLHRT